MSFYEFMPTLLNMSLTASVAIVLVILLRLLLKKAPKVISYALWGVVLFRLLCPVSIGSSFSLYNLFNAPTEESGTVTSVIEYVPSNIVHTEYPSVALPVPGISDVINETLPQGEEQLRADPLEGPIFIATYVWMAGVLAMVIYSIVSYIRLRRKLSVVVPLRDNIFIADDIKSPFVVGLFRPKIYLPCNLGDKEQEYIILHEQHHIKRLDHVMTMLPAPKESSMSPSILPESATKGTTPKTVGGVSGLNAPLMINVIFPIKMMESAMMRKIQIAENAIFHGVFFFLLSFMINTSIHYLIYCDRNCITNAERISISRNFRVQACGNITEHRVLGIADAIYLIRPCPRKCVQCVDRVVDVVICRIVIDRGFDFCEIALRDHIAVAAERENDGAVDLLFGHLIENIIQHRHADHNARFYFGRTRDRKRNAAIIGAGCDDLVACGGLNGNRAVTGGIFRAERRMIRCGERHAEFCSACEIRCTSACRISSDRAERQAKRQKHQRHQKQT